MTRRAQVVCDSSDSLQDETDYLNNVFSKNNYNADFLTLDDTLTDSSAYSNPQTNVDSGPVTTATISYMYMSHVCYNLTIPVTITKKYIQGKMN